MLGTTLKLVGLLALSGGFTSEPVVGIENEGQFGRALLEQQDGDEDAEIAKLKAELRLPGPEARQKREGAVAALLGMKAPKAHEVLQEVLLDGQDTDGMIPSVLAQLIGRLANTRDPVFGAGEVATRELRRSYIRSLVRLAGGEPPGGEPVVELARRALQQFDSGDRVPVFEELLRPGSPDRVAAARAAGSCRDLGLVEKLGAWLADPELRKAAREGLRGLTFRDFASKDELDTWWQSLGTRTFVDLAVDAATRGRDRLQAELESVLLALIDAYVAHPEIPWKKLGEQVLRAEPAGFTLRALQRVRTLLAPAPKLTGSVPDRQALRDELVKRLGRELVVGTPESYAVMLEVCAYLIGSGDDPREVAARGDVELRLREALLSRDDVVRQAAVTAIRRFPSEQNRLEVVRVGKAALDALGEGHNARVLGAVLGTLHAQDWTAPTAKEDRAAWLAVVQPALERSDVPEDMRREALAVLKLRDAGKGRVSEAFEIVSDLCADATQSARIRELALIELPSFVADETQSNAYVELLARALADRESGIRSRAANLLHELPAWKLPGSETDARTKAWARRLLDEAAARLLEETDPTVHESVVYSMRRIADERDERERVIDLMSGALEEIARVAPARSEPFRRKNIVQELRILASDPERKPELWVRAAEAIAGVGERMAARAILERHEEAKSLMRAGVAAELVERARLLTIRVAMMRAGEGSWNDKELRAEAQSVLDAIAHLDARPALSPSEQAEITLLEMAIAGDREQHDRVIELARTLPANGGLTDAQRQRAALRLARSHLELERPDEALNALSRLTGNGAVAGEVLNLLEKICAQLVAVEQFPKAQEAGKLLVDRTPDSSPHAAARLLMYAHALYKVDPETNADRVRALLEEKRALFEAAPKELQKQFDDLRQRVQPGETREQRPEVAPAPAGSGAGQAGGK